MNDLELSFWLGIGKIILSLTCIELGAMFFTLGVATFLIPKQEWVRAHRKQISFDAFYDRYYVQPGKKILLFTHFCILVLLMHYLLDWSI